MKRVHIARGRRDRMVVGFAITYAIIAYSHLRCEIESHSMKHYVMKFFSDLRHLGGFIGYFGFLYQ